MRSATTAPAARTVRQRTPSEQNGWEISSTSPRWGRLRARHRRRRRRHLALRIRLYLCAEHGRQRDQIAPETLRQGGMQLLRRQVGSDQRQVARRRKFGCSIGSLSSIDAALQSGQLLLQRCELRLYLLQLVPQVPHVARGLIEPCLVI